MKLILFAALFDDAVSALAEAFSNSNYVLGIVSLVVMAALIVLKLLKKDFPFIEPLGKLLLGASKLFKSNNQKVAEEAKKQEEAAQPGLAQVVPLEKKDESK